MCLNFLSDYRIRSLPFHISDSSWISFSGNFLVNLKWKMLGLGENYTFPYIFPYIHSKMLGAKFHVMFYKDF